MNDMDVQKKEEIEIDLSRVFRAVMNKAWLVIFISVLCAIITFAVTLVFVKPKYESSAMFYVNNSNLSLGDASVSITSGDLSTSRNLVDSYIVILNTRETLVDVLDYSAAPYTYRELREMISAESVNETEIFRVTVTSTDPNEAERIANAVAYILPKRISTIIDGTSARVADAAVVPSSPSSPSYTKNAVVGFLAGFILMVGIIALREIFDTTIRVEEDIKQGCKHPILASVPLMTAPSKGGYYSSAHSRKGKHLPTAQHGKLPVIGPNISFAASEAYKLLRTKLLFSFADENEIGRASCRERV